MQNQVLETFRICNLIVIFWKKKYNEIDSWQQRLFYNLSVLISFNEQNWLSFIFNRWWFRFQVYTVFWFWCGYGGLGSLVCSVPRSDGALSPITTPESPSSPTLSSARILPGEEARSFDSAGVSPATSMSITDRTTELLLLSPPLVPLPPSIQVQSDPALLLQLATAHDQWLPQPPPVSVSDSPPVLFHEGPFECLKQRPAPQLRGIIQW